MCHIHHKKKSMQGGECCVCTYDISPDNAIYLKCGHCTHLTCMTRWCRQSPTCPVCRSDLDRKDLARVVAERLEKVTLKWVASPHYVMTVLDSMEMALGIENVQ